MITPVFEVSEDDDFVIIMMKVPHMKVRWRYCCCCCVVVSAPDLNALRLRACVRACVRLGLELRLLH